MGRKLLKVYVIRPVRNFCLYHLARFVSGFRYIIPRKVVDAWHGLLARIAYPFIKPLQKTVEENLKIAYGDAYSSKEAYKFGKKLLVLLVHCLTDYIWLSHKKTREQFSKYFTFEGEEHLKAAYERGKGVICMVPHTCAWEFSAIMPPVMGYETSAVSSKLRNPGLNKFIINLRETRGMKNISRENSRGLKNISVKERCYDKLVAALNKGECLIIMIDQDSVNIKGEFLQFFGHRAYSPLGVARLALDTEAAIVPMFTVRNNDGTYTFKIRPEVKMELTGDRAADITHNSQIHNDVMESIVREYPDQWLWFHKRWKTTPESLAFHLKVRADEWELARLADLKKQEEEQKKEEKRQRRQQRRQKICNLFHCK
jgi:KDO2-lipid IV(A) lauroyltransferase